MKKYFVLTAVGFDRPGIVAEVSEIIYKCGCNLEDSRMSLLGNHFALLILLSGKEEGVFKELSKKSSRLQDQKDLSVFLFPMKTKGHEPPEETPEPNYEIRVVGLDRAGIVFRTSQLMASRNINIVDLETRIDPASESGSPIFTMNAKLAVPKDVDGKEFRNDLKEIADELFVEISLSRTSDLVK